MTQQSGGGSYSPRRSDINQTNFVSRLFTRLPLGKLKSRWGIVGAMGLIIIIISIALFSAQKTSSNAQNDYFDQRLETIKQSSKEIETYISLHPRETARTDNLKAYTDSLLSASLACQEMRQYAGTNGDEMSESLSNSAQQVNLFCTDLEDITDYARRVSRATEQLLTYDISLLTTDNTVKPVQDMHDILGFTRTDIAKLKTHPTQDPATEEMLAMLDASLQLSSAALADPSPVNRQVLTVDLSKLQNNLSTAKQYFWTNTVKIDAMQRSINRLQELFQEKKS